MENPFSVRGRSLQPKQEIMLHQYTDPIFHLHLERMEIYFSITWISRKVLNGFTAAALLAFASNHSVIGSLNQTSTVKTFQNVCRKSLAQKRFLEIEVPNMQDNVLTSCQRAACRFWSRWESSCLSHPLRRICCRQSSDQLHTGSQYQVYLIYL